MYGDFSRMTFAPAKAYTGVWSQQGRVQLDADANEQTAILLDWLRTLAVDFIGPFGGHVTRAGFQVGLSGRNVTLSPGHYYVYGLRCEIPVPADPKDPGATFRDLVPNADALTDSPLLVEMLVWERSVSAVADPDLLEPALGPYPPDTTVRTQVAWKPSVASTLPDGTPLKNHNPEHICVRFEEYNAGGSPRPLLAARAEPDVETEDASIVPTNSGYLGVENQLYRVEIHNGGKVGTETDGPTFKWSRDNGSAEFRIVVPPGAEAPGPVAAVTVAALGRDERTGLELGDWVEFVDDTWVPRGPLAPLLKVKEIDRASLTVTLSDEITIDPALHPYLRRWDGTGDSAAGIPVAESSGGGWHELEDGVEVRFAPAGGLYQPGDYWCVPARTATGGLLWPSSSETKAAPAAVQPHGPIRYLVPLALITEDKGKGRVKDLRTRFTNLAWPDADDLGDETDG
jgi:hypothetical protein